MIIPSAKRAPIAQPLGWASIFAAAAITMGIALLLHLFGIGVGLTSIETDDPGSLRAVGIGTGIWTIIAPIIALFIGGLVAGRTAPTLDSWNAAIHAAAAWAVNAVVSVLLLSMVLGALARGAVSTVSTIGNAASMPLSSIAGEQVPDLSALGIGSEDFVARLNNELASRGMPPVEAKNVERVVQEAMETAVRNGGIDRETLVAITAKHTALSRGDAERLANDIEQRLEAVQARGSRIADRTGEMALEAIEGTGKLLLFLSLAMLLGLGAAMGGAMIAVRRERRDHVVPADPRV